MLRSGNRMGLSIGNRIKEARMDAITPKGSEEAVCQLRLSPAVVSNGSVFVTGMTGSRVDGSMPRDLREQFEQAFEKIGSVLHEAGADFARIVEMTSYHIGIGDHFDLFCEVRADYVFEPYPAWTAVEVVGLRRDGAVVEIRVVASLED